MFQAIPDSALSIAWKILLVRDNPDSYGLWHRLATVASRVFISAADPVLRFLTCRPDSSQRNTTTVLSVAVQPPPWNSTFQGCKASCLHGFVSGFFDIGSGRNPNSNAIAKAENAAIFNWDSLSFHFVPFFGVFTRFSDFSFLFFKDLFIASDYRDLIDSQSIAPSFDFLNVFNSGVNLGLNLIFVKLGYKYTFVAVGEFLRIGVF